MSSRTAAYVALALTGAWMTACAGKGGSGAANESGSASGATSTNGQPDATTGASGGSGSGASGAATLNDGGGSGATGASTGSSGGASTGTSSGASGGSMAGSSGGASTGTSGGASGGSDASVGPDAGGSIGGNGAGLDGGVATCSGPTPWTTSGTPAYSLVVDAAQKGAPWNRFYEQGIATDHANTVLSSAYPFGRGIQAALKKGHDQAGFQYARFHGILDSDIGVYTEDASGTPVYTWTNFDRVYDALQAASMRPIVEMSFMPPALASNTCLTANNCPLLPHYYGGVPANATPPKDWTKWQNLMTAIVTHLEGRYGKAEVENNWYFEVWNEASWMYSGGGIGGPYNLLYSNTVTGLLKGDPLVKVGGPAESGGGSAYAIGSLISYAKTNNLKLDFVSYHNYGEPAANNVANAIPMLAFQKTLLSAVKNTGFTGTILEDEFAAAYDYDVRLDTEVSASFIAKTIHLIATDPSNAPPSTFAYWTLSDFYQEVNTGTNTAYHGNNSSSKGLLLRGDSRYPISFDLAKPPFNAFRLLHAMGDVSLTTTGGTTANGVNAAATISSDGSAVQILIYNHVDGGAASSTTSNLVKLTINNLPFAAGPLKVRQYVVDHTNSNSYTAWVAMGSPPQPSAAQWAQLATASDLCYFDTTATPVGGAWTATFPQSIYSVSLVVVSP